MCISLGKELGQAIYDPLSLSDLNLENKALTYEKLNGNIIVKLMF